VIRGAGVTWAGGEGGAITGGAGASGGAVGTRAGLGAVPAGVLATVLGSSSWVRTRMVNTPTIAADSASPASRNFSERAQ
jgi:hypothetical protein